MTEKQLRLLYRKLKREFPELLGLGIGRATKGGKLQTTNAIKLLVAKKVGRRSRAARHFPKTITLRLGKGTRPITIILHTDVEEAPRWTPTSFSLDTNGNNQFIATLYAAWVNRNGQPAKGLVTVAHPLTGPGQPVDITIGTGTATGQVVLRSDLLADGLDVGLVALPDPFMAALPVLPVPLSPGAMSSDDAIALLGISDTDAKYSPIENWFTNTPSAGRALAFYVQYTINQPAGPSYILNNVIYSDGIAGTYAKGKSGAPWIVATSTLNQPALALQSHGNQDNSFRTGLGIHLATALNWLKQQPQLQNIHFAWRFTDL